VKINLGQLQLMSPEFVHASRLPERLTVQGAPSPELSWRNVPPGTQSFAVVCHDPDAPLVDGFTHWVIYGIPSDCASLSEGATEPFVAGANGMGGTDYMPPGPPPGHGDHFYYFHLYALSTPGPLEPGLDRDALLAAIDADILEQARIVGVWSNG
jgi:Raf kinase inhibitor-like YbhB/YbcL family protein